MVDSESRYNLQKRVWSKDTGAKFAENSEESEIELQLLSNLEDIDFDLEDL